MQSLSQADEAGSPGGVSRLSAAELLASQLEYCSSIRDCATLLQSLVSSVLDSSKVRGPVELLALELGVLSITPLSVSCQINSGLMLLESIPLDLQCVVKKSLSLLRASAVDRGVVLAEDIPAELPSVLFGDPLRLQQVLS